MPELIRSLMVRIQYESIIFFNSSVLLNTLTIIQGKIGLELCDRSTLLVPFGSKIRRHEVMRKTS